MMAQLKSSYYSGLKNFYGIHNLKTDEDFKKEFLEHFYYPNVCQYCLKFDKDKPVKSCTNCKVMFYCSDEHQLAHYNDKHKEFCTALTKLTGDKEYLFQNCDLSDLRTRINLIEKAQIEVTTRDLQLYERNTFIFPRVCIDCNESNPEEIRSCPNCPFATFCKNHYYKILLHKKNENGCQLFNEVFYVDNHWLAFKDLPLEYIINPFPINKLLKTKLSKDMETFIRESVVPHQTKIKFNEKKIIFNADIKVISTVFTRSLTLIHALEELNVEYWAQSKVVCVLNKEKNLEEKNFKEFEILHHWFPKMTKLTVLFIGCKKIPGNINLCTNCKELKKKMRIVSSELGYNKYYQSTSSVPKPDIIMAYNVDYRTHDAWADSSSLLTELQIPIVLTAMNKPYLIAAARDCVTNPRNFSKIKENPFKSLRKERFLNDVSSSNRFISIYHKKFFSKICQADNPCKSCFDCEMNMKEVTGSEEILKTEESLNDLLYKKLRRMDKRVEKLRERQKLYNTQLLETKSEIVNTYFHLEGRVSSVLQDLLHASIEFDEDDEDDGIENE